jgi:uncharacterized protein
LSTAANAVLYLDSSALVKLVIRERETDALRQFVTSWPNRVSSVVAYVEVHRAARRESARAAAQAEAVLQLVNLIEIDEGIVEAAASVKPPDLRTLDAIHIASALSLRGDLGVFVTYDGRQSDAARAVGLEIAAPAD